MSRYTPSTLLEKAKLRVLLSGQTVSLIDLGFTLSQVVTAIT